MELSPEAIARMLRIGRTVSDEAFDACLPDAPRRASARFWSSVQVARLAAEWLSAHGVTRVLDVGSGVGKFCVVGALTSELSFVGIEHRPHLVAVARELAERFGVTERVEFVPGTFGSTPLPRFDALYFYNPFAEAPFPRSNHFDKSVELGEQRSERDVAAAQRVLHQLPIGTHVVTYNSFGGTLPDSFDLVRAQAAGVDQLRLWRKARVRAEGGVWLELVGATVLRRNAAEIALVVVPQPKHAAE